jgi:hypothetical protein
MTTTNKAGAFGPVYARDLPHQAKKTLEALVLRDFALMPRIGKEERVKLGFRVTAVVGRVGVDLPGRVTGVDVQDGRDREHLRHT